MLIPSLWKVVGLGGRFDQLHVSHTHQACHDDGNGNVIDENGGPEPMDYIVDQNDFVAEIIATHTKYLETVPPNEFSLACPMLLEKPKNEDVRIEETNTKRAYMRCIIQDKARFSDLKIKKGPKCILSEEHKATIITFIDSNPSATVVEVAEHLLKQFHDLKVSRSTVNNFMRCERNLSLKENRYSFC
ncbi:Homeodomain-like DNA binding domain-containing transcription factor [Phycomyces blakesleeanus NRRL 1555(-)]|uniref:Homeodomain-like DNA binding domain-containing transcription factor n=1 Tax=Phycomyces blakesleeanus (strain ATCC 8743b / DSM 1359 / FGSC 10004 / NBRC 33097 / NRRL 1555) TaxID=763407 RepID=A0A167QZ00_PHYB8|nr:Homeodomain-like DNA binding domain-containing transcription factor [Phycomyces blakesleeanus NRRL 1555(-)]OAD80497.1 Homeodomain-like DNA binding domain-containing transcription factor [Phycomyces blakesleeanus NRRL 1555(-)]|eukprot:XP_018298537.1 Homeodomain-like DNA binding domain-containing transcription factor [Phycomyces blakesleeanus NRRL 1555(-)]